MIPLTRTAFPPTLVLLISVGLWACGPAAEAPPDAGAMDAFEVDPFWPKPLPNQWILGQVAGVAVDARDHVWVIHRPGSLTPCCRDSTRLKCIAVPVTSRTRGSRLGFDAPAHSPALLEFLA